MGCLTLRVEDLARLVQLDGMGYIKDGVEDWKSIKSSSSLSSSTLH